jgi:hypothetical protein
MNTSSVVPAVFEPLRLRKLSRYRSLTHHVFSPSEKLWIFYNVSKNMSNAQQRGRQISTFCRRHSISSKIVKEWITSIDNGEAPVASSANRKRIVSTPDDYSCCIDTVGLEALNELMVDSDATVVTDETVKDFIWQQMDATTERRTLAIAETSKLKPGKRVFIDGVFAGKRLVINGLLSKKIFK